MYTGWSFPPLFLILLSPKSLSLPQVIRFGFLRSCPALLSPAPVSFLVVFFSSPPFLERCDVPPFRIFCFICGPFMISFFSSGAFGQPLLVFLAQTCAWRSFFRAAVPFRPCVFFVSFLLPDSLCRLPPPGTSQPPLSLSFSATDLPLCCRQVPAFFLLPDKMMLFFFWRSCSAVVGWNCSSLFLAEVVKVEILAFMYRYISFFSRVSPPPPVSVMYRAP